MQLVPKVIENEIKNPYGLQAEFRTKKALNDYLTARGFIQDSQVTNAWSNGLSGVDAHVYLVRDDRFSRVYESYLTVYWAPHIERLRLKTKVKSEQIAFITKSGGKLKVNYAM